MTRFGDFTLVEDLGKSAVADRFKAMHTTQGGPFFLKVYARLESTLHNDLLRRCQALIGTQHPNLARHLGHGVVDGMPFVVAPFLDGIGLADLATSLTDRRVHLSLDAALILLGDLATAVGALQGVKNPDPTGPLGHGEVAIHHVRVGTEGQVWLTGLTTPRGEGPGRPAEARWDIPGVGALVYDLVPLMSGGAARPPLPTSLDRVVRRALGIGSGTEAMPPKELAERINDVARTLNLREERSTFAELVKRTVRVVEKKLAESGPRAAPTAPVRGGPRQTPADAIPSLTPVDRIPTLEPIRAQASSSSPGRPAATPPPASTTSQAPPVPVLEASSNVSTDPRSRAMPTPSAIERAAVLRGGKPPSAAPTPQAPTSPAPSPTSARPSGSGSSPPQPAPASFAPASFAPASFAPAPVASAPVAQVPFGQSAPTYGAAAPAPAPATHTPPAQTPFGSAPFAPTPFAPAPPAHPSFAPAPPPAPGPAPAAPWAQMSHAPWAPTSQVPFGPTTQPPLPQAPPPSPPPGLVPGSLPAVAHGPSPPGVAQAFAPAAPSPFAAVAPATSLDADPFASFMPAPAPEPESFPAPQHRAVEPRGAGQAPPWAPPAAEAPRATHPIATAPTSPPPGLEARSSWSAPATAAPWVAPAPPTSTMGAKSATPASVPSAPQSGGDYATKSVAPRMAAVSAAPKAMLLVDPLDAAAPEETAPAGPPTAPGQSPSAGRAPVADVFDAAPEPTNPGIRSMRMDAARAQRSVQALARRGLVDAQALDAALEEVGARGGRVLEHLVTRGTIDEGTIADVLAQDAGCARLPDDALRTRTPPGALMRRLPHTYLLARRVLPLSFEDGTVVVVMADPHDAGTLDELRSILNAQRVDRVVASRSAITNATIAMVRSLGMGGDSLTQGNAPRALLCMSDDGKAARLGARLAGEGIRIEHVVDGETARHILTTRPPDVVLCAHDIAGVSVTALLLAARSNGPTEELPFYVFGPRGNDELATSVLELGADDFFGEPIKDDLVLAKVRRAVGKTRTLHPEPVVLPDPGPPPPAPGLPDMAAVLSEQTPMVALAPEPADIGPSSERDDALLSGAPLLDEGFDELPDLPDFDLLDPNEGTPAMPTGVMGTLRQMSLSDIVQSLELGRKTARVEIVPTLGEKGMVAFDDGQVRFAECGLLTSDEAFFQLARHTEGFFRIHYGNKPPSVNVHSPTTLLLLEAMRRMDEGKGNG